MVHISCFQGKKILESGDIKIVRIIRPEKPAAVTLHILILSATV